MSTLFELAFYAATPFCALMILLTTWSWTIAWDLFTGRWPLLMGPLLVLTVIGFPLYLALRRNLIPLASTTAHLASS